jgi:hypothetical protein
LHTPEDTVRSPQTQHPSQIWVWGALIAPLAHPLQAASNSVFKPNLWGCARIPVRCARPSSCLRPALSQRHMLFSGPGAIPCGRRAGFPVARLKRDPFPDLVRPASAARAGEAPSVSARPPPRTPLGTRPDWPSCRVAQGTSSSRCARLRRSRRLALASVPPRRRSRRLSAARTRGASSRRCAVTTYSSRGTCGSSS